MHNFNWVFLKCLKLLKVNAGGDLVDFFRVELRDWREVVEILNKLQVYSLQLAFLIYWSSKRGVVSQQAVEIKAKEKWLYLT